MSNSFRLFFFLLLSLVSPVALNASGPIPGVYRVDSNKARVEVIANGDGSFTLISERPGFFHKDKNVRANHDGSFTAWRIPAQVQASGTVISWNGGQNYWRLHNPNLPVVMNLPVDGRLNNGNKPNDCGPVSTARLLRYVLKKQITPAQIENVSGGVDQRLIREFGFGTKPGTVEEAMRRYGYRAKYENQTSIRRIQDLISRGKPVVALIRPSRNGKELHYIVVNGFDRNRRKIYFTDTDGKQYSYSEKGFYSVWEWDYGLGDLFLRGLNIRSRVIVH